MYKIRCSAFYTFTDILFVVTILYRRLLIFKLETDDFNLEYSLHTLT